MGERWRLGSVLLAKMMKDGIICKAKIPPEQIYQNSGCRSRHFCRIDAYAAAVAQSWCRRAEGQCRFLALSGCVNSKVVILQVIIPVWCGEVQLCMRWQASDAGRSGVSPGRERRAMQERGGRSVDCTRGQGQVSESGGVGKRTCSFAHFEKFRQRDPERHQGSLAWRAAERPVSLQEATGWAQYELGRVAGVQGADLWDRRSVAARNGRLERVDDGVD